MKNQKNEILEKQEILLQNILEEKENNLIVQDLKKNVKGCKGSFGNLIFSINKKYDLSIK